MYITIHDDNYIGWDEIINSVQTKYKKAYGAVINVNPQYFIAVYKTPDLKELMGCAGLKFANQGDLFSEQYLEEPIERILNSKLEKNINREEIVEIGALTSVSGGIGSLIVRKIPFLAKCLGAKYLLCTVTADVRKLMEFNNIKFVKICDSDNEKLKSEKLNWGSYYDNQPETGYIVIDNLMQSQISKKIIYSIKTTKAA